MSKTAAGAYLQRLHALDAAIGTELLGGPQTIQASYPGTGAGSSGGSAIFDPKQYEERAGLLELNGQIVLTVPGRRTVTSIPVHRMAYRL